MAWAGKMALGRWLSCLACCIVAATGFELEFLSEPSSRLAKLSDGRVVFRCEVSPSSAEVRWLWKGQTMLSNRYVKVSKHKLTVHLSKVDKNSRFPYSSENGYFQCEARTREKALVSAPAELIVAVLDPFPAHEDIHVEVIKGNTAVIPCQPPYSVPTVVTEFLFNNVTIDKSSSRLMVMKSGSLQVFEVNDSDAGEYTCVAYNPFLSEKRQADHKVILHVSEPGATSAPLHFVVSPQPNTAVVLGSNITLECAAMSYPVPSITWRRQQGNLPRSRYQQVAGNLLLFGVHRADEGTYTCEAENSLGSHMTMSTVLEVHETPQIIKPPKDAFVLEGDNVTFHCGSQGHPKPDIVWLHNGKSVDSEPSDKTGGSKLTLLNITHKHTGVYQCFVRNELGTTYATSFLTIPSGNKSHDSDYGSEDDYDDYDSDMHPPKYHHGRGRPSNHHHSKHLNAPENGSDLNNEADIMGKRHRKKKKHKGVKLVPPSRPEITRLSDTSVMVRWGVPRNDGLPILFFKVQYREVGKRFKDWMTVDENIEAHIHSYAVTDLRNGGRYRFRIAAVYSNNDNKLGPNSAKFVLHKDPPMKKPVSGPIITHAEAVSPSAITLHWEYTDIDSIPVEGFFIYYRTTHSAGDYLKVTVLGANTRSHIISHLLPSTGYDIKMQCFNIAGTSAFSNIYNSKTKPSENMDTRNRNVKTHHMGDEIAIVSVTEPVSSKDSDGNIILDIVLGVISAAMLISITVFVVIYVKQRLNRPSNVNNREAPVKASNGHTANGYLPVDKVNISVNPLSEIDGDDTDKPDQPEAVVSNNNEIIHLQTFSTNECPQLEPLLAQGMNESAAGEAAEETVILQGDDVTNSEGPRSI